MSLEKLGKIIDASENIVFFGGAGVSTESGIPDFRTESGIYSTKNHYAYPPEVMLSRSFFMEHTEDFFDFYKNKMIFPGVKPNPAHFALAALEKRGKLKAVITQNIDSLHQQAGSKNVIELHGSVHRNYCMDCKKGFGLEYVVESGGMVPTCDCCGSTVKPDVVLYEEELDTEAITGAVSYISKAEVLIIGGTSLVVYPAAGLVKYYKGNKLVLINKSATSMDDEAALVFNDSIGKVLGSVVK